MKRFRKVYLEISNLCNLRCRFCPGTGRKAEAMDRERFEHLLEKLVGWTDHLYFHLMGEPLCHPLLGEFLDLAGQRGFKVILTTNGTLLPARQELLLAAPALHKVNISLHAFEANDLPATFEDYLSGCVDFGRAAAGSKLVVYRLWNEGGEDRLNERVLEVFRGAFPGEWKPQRRGVKLAGGVFLEHGEKFDWPDLSAREGSEDVFCYGLRDQIGVLCDGTVVPCCLDHEGDVVLGNLLEQTMGEIMAAPRTRAICAGFAQGKAVEALCRRCGFAKQKFG
ncbi:MAG: radical SAM protein [Ruminococcaceae bacterium]|nr:radical SAM protein [Oscillospiraceae bacterium]